MAGRGSVLVIQSDWHDSLRDNNTSAWVYHKRCGEAAQYGKVGGAVTDKNFEVISRTQRTIKIKHGSSGMSVVFIAPVATFSNIHLKSVVSMGVGEGGLGVSICTDNKLHVWETDTGIIRRSLDGHLFDVYTCKLFPSGTVVLSAGGDMQLRIWDAITGERSEPLRSLDGHLFDVYTCKLFPSGTVVLSAGGDMQLRIWDAVTGNCPVILKGHTAAVLDTAIVHRGKNIVSVSKDGTAKLWNCGEAKCIDTIFNTESIINCCAITDVNGIINLPSPHQPLDNLEHCTSGKLLLVGCEEGSAHLIAIASREVIASFSLSSPVLSVCWAIPSRAVLGLADGRLILLNADTKTTEQLSHDSASPVQSLCPYSHTRDGREGGILVGRRDGICQFYWTDGLQNDISASSYQLTGCDCDPVYSIVTDANYIYTASRDSQIRKYRKKDLSP